MKYLLIFLFSFFFFKSFSQSELNSVLNKINEGLSIEDKRTFEFYFYQGLEQKNRGDFQNALNSFLKCVDIDKNSAVVLFEAGKILVYGGQSEKGIELLNKACALNNDNIWYALTLANIYVNSERISSAIAILENLHQTIPDNFDLTFNLISLYEQNKQFDKAITLLLPFAKLNEYADDVNLEIYKLYLNSNNLNDAVKLMKTSYKKVPSSKFALLIGDAYAIGKDFKNALKWYNKSFKHNPNYGATWLSLLYLSVENKDEISFRKAFDSIVGNSDIDSDIKLGVGVNILSNDSYKFLNHSEIDSMISDLYRINSMNKNFNSFYANYCISKDDTIGSIKYLKREIQFYPDNNSAWLQLLSTYLQTDSLSEAEAIFNEGKELNPMSDWFMLGSFVSFKLKDYNATIKNCIEGIKLSNNDKSIAQFSAQIGDAYFALNERDSVIKYYDIAIKYNNEDKLLLNNYAYYLSVFNINLSLAESMASKCVSIDPGNYTFLDTYAWVLFRKKEYILAKFYIEKALELLKIDEGVIFEHYGDILFFLDDKDKAILNWRKAKSLGVDSKFIDKKIEEKRYIED